MREMRQLAPARARYRVCLAATGRRSVVFACDSAAQRGAGSVRRDAWLERATAVWGAVTVRAMHRLLVLYPPPSDPDHFRSYYENTHLPLVAKFPCLRGYRYSF